MTKQAWKAEIRETFYAALAAAMLITFTVLTTHVLEAVTVQMNH